MRILLAVIAILALIGFAAAQIPLGFVLRKLPLNSMGVQWTQSEGTIWNGRIMGVYANGQPVGDVDLSLKPMSLVTFKPELEFQWGGAGGRGAGTIRLLGSDSVEARDVRFQQNVAELEGLANDVRAVGGTIRMSGGAVTIEDGACRSASGNFSADTLSLAAQQFGREFSDLTGTLSCSAGAFDIDLGGEGPAGDRVTIDASATLQGQGTIDVIVETQDREVETLLANAGFSREGEAWTYRRDAPAGGTGAP